MIYPELFHDLERARWNMADDIPWQQFDGVRLSDEQAVTIKMNAITEWSALPATEMFLRDNQDDSDFSAFMSIWFYEEQKHSLVLIEYLKRFRPDLVPSEAELQAFYSAAGTWCEVAIETGEGRGYEGGVSRFAMITLQKSG